MKMQSLQLVKKSVYIGLTAVSLGFLTSCGDDDGDTDPLMEVPSTYEFERDGESSVSFSGQTTRLDMLAEMKALVLNADGGASVSESALLNMFANENSPFEDSELNSATKDLESKTFISDVDFYKDLFAELGTVSARIESEGTTASQGVAGLLDRDGNGKTILVNEKGWEYTQFIEKGLMGAVFYNQIYNVYMTDDRVGDAVSNDVVEEGTNYTSMEHHWDEAFGYFGVPIDFPAGDPVLESDEDRFWAKYTIDLDDEALLPGINSTLMNAYITGRTAIVNKQYDIKDQQRELIYKWHEIVAAATAIHYLNSTIDDFNNNDIPNAFHHLSEAYMFTKALQYSPNKVITQSEINTILNTNMGTDADFWTATIEGLTTAKNTIASKYTELEAIKDIL
jgi:hypothetical protein